MVGPGRGHKNRMAPPPRGGAQAARPCRTRGRPTAFVGPPDSPGMLGTRSPPQPGGSPIRQLLQVGGLDGSDPRGDFTIRRVRLLGAPAFGDLQASWA